MLLLVLVKVTHNPTLTADKAKRTQLNIHLHFLPLGIVRQS